jgi:1,4-dihydroxy-6-naphthoate synthase
MQDGATREITKLLLRSIEHAMENREKSLAWATQWGRGINMANTDEFVEMYVNRWTLDFGAQGKTAVHQFLKEAAKVGAVPEIETVAFV